MAIKNLFADDLKLVNVGTKTFINDYVSQQIDFVDIDWSPSAGGDLETLALLKSINPYRKQIDQANTLFVTRIKAAEGRLIAVKKALDVIPNMTKHTILHAGPPIQFELMCGPMQGAIIGAIIYEGLAANEQEAYTYIKSGKIIFDAAHHHDAVGPMAGIISASMPVHVIYNITHKNYAYATINEGLGKVLRYGANSSEVIQKLHFIEDLVMPILNDALILSGGIDVKSIMIQALHMGDECHNRNKAATALFLREIVGFILQTKHTNEDKLKVIDFIKQNEHYFLNLSMPFCKVALDSTKSIKNTSLVRIMSRNGVNFGLKIAGLDQWFEAEANYIEGLLFPGYKKEDANPDIGDSAITETFGVGGFAMGGAPAIVQFVGGVVEDAFNYSRLMHEITYDKHQVFTLPTLDFMSTGLGIDILKVLEYNILPIINTGIAHKLAGVGQIGAGLVLPPLECFKKALKGLLTALEGGAT